MSWRALLGAVAAMFVLSAASSAQATRTWVSGVGDDANPCSRTAPCKTFAGAISKTAAGGEINVLDPGGFGAVTITKSITISSERFEAGVLVSAGTNGIVINAAPTDFVVLRGLDFEGLGSGLNGIRFLAGGSLHVEDCTIERFGGFGIDFEPSGAAQLTVSNTVVRENGGVSGGGILLKPGAAGAVNASFDRLIATRNRVGLRVEDGAKASLRSSTVSNSTIFGVHARSTATAASANITDSQIVNNTSAGIRSEGAAASVRLTDSAVFDNATGLASLSGGAILSFGNNRIAGNGVDGSPTGVLTQQ